MHLRHSLGWGAPSADIHGSMTSTRGSAAHTSRCAREWVGVPPKTDLCGCQPSLKQISVHASVGRSRHPAKRTCGAVNASPAKRTCDWRTTSAESRPTMQWPTRRGMPCPWFWSFARPKEPRPPAITAVDDQRPEVVIEQGVHRYASSMDSWTGPRLDVCPPSHTSGWVPFIERLW